METHIIILLLPLTKVFLFLSITPRVWYYNMKYVLFEWNYYFSLQRIALDKCRSHCRLLCLDRADTKFLRSTWTERCARYLKNVIYHVYRKIVFSFLRFIKRYTYIHLVITLFSCAHVYTSCLIINDLPFKKGGKNILARRGYLSEHCENNIGAVKKNKVEKITR